MTDPYRYLPLDGERLTPEHVYLNRKQFLKAAGFIGAGALLAACLPNDQQVDPTTPATQTVATPEPALSSIHDELGDKGTSQKEVESVVNYYELSVNKKEATRLGAGLKTEGWTLEVGGLVERPLVLDMAGLAQRFASEERIYRMRCVEAWSMVIPWMGFELRRLLDASKPLPAAKYIAFESAFRPAEMPGTSSPYPWPYREGLRLDEAMNPLTVLATGLYGKPLKGQNGAPVRLVVPWKYGFKSIKSLVKLTLTDVQPPTFWNTLAPKEYGFYANVNPAVPHPRWSQASEIRIGEEGRRDTLLFNGYGKQVASLYEGMDLRTNY